MDGFIQMWLVPECDRQADARQLHWPAFIGLFFTECLIIRCSSNPWCTFAQQSFINPDEHMTKSVSCGVLWHFITARAVGVDDDSALVCYWSALKVHLRRCYLYPFTCALCVLWWITDVHLKSLRSVGLIEISYRSVESVHVPSAWCTFCLSLLSFFV